MFRIWKTRANQRNDDSKIVAQDRLRDQRNESRLRQFVGHSLALTVVGGLCIGAAGFVNGPTMVEKILTELASPVGFIWLILLAMTYFGVLLQQVWPTFVSLSCWLLLTIAGNSLFANWLISTLEAPYLTTQPLELEKLDSLIVLGGGTKFYDQLTQFGEGGDRVGLAARMYHAGKTDQIICTGSSTYRASNNEPHAREQSAELLMGLLVPADRIVLLEGHNTSQEMASLKQHFAALSSKPSRIGLITSAFHLSRAMRLAKSHGLDLIPIPADVKGAAFRPNPSLVIPDEGNLLKTELAIKEYLAWWVGR